MEQKEFKVGTYTFRPKNMRPSEILAIESIVNFDDVDAADKMFSTILEKVEVKIADTWQPLKEKGAEVYYPVGIENNLSLLYQVCVAFMKDIITPLFQKSEESKK